MAQSAHLAMFHEFSDDGSDLGGAKHATRQIQPEIGNDTLPGELARKWISLVVVTL